MATQPCLPVEVAQPAPRRSRQARVVWGSRVVTVGGVAAWIDRGETDQSVFSSLFKDAVAERGGEHLGKEGDDSEAQHRKFRQC